MFSLSWSFRFLSNRWLKTHSCPFLSVCFPHAHYIVFSLIFAGCQGPPPFQTNKQTQMSNEKNPGWLDFIGAYTTQFFRDYNNPLYIRMPIHQPGVLQKLYLKHKTSSDPKVPFEADTSMGSDAESGEAPARHIWMAKARCNVWRCTAGADVAYIYIYLEPNPQVVLAPQVHPGTLQLAFPILPEFGRLNLIWLVVSIVFYFHPENCGR